MTPKGLLGAGALFGLGTTIPGLIRTAFGGLADAAGNARELERTMRTVDDVFGDSSQTIHDWGEAAADAAGLSKREVTTAAVTMGQTLINMGLDADEAADLVVRAQQRAADHALAMGGNTEDVLVGISALLRGEYDTIEKFGVSIKQADVNARAMEMGLDMSTAAAKRQSTAIAALDLLFEQTAISAGRFSDANDDAGVAAERAGAKWENFIDTTIGPAINSALDEMASDLESSGKGLEQVGDFFNGLAMFFGSQRTELLRAADDIGVGFNTLQERVAHFMSTGLSFEDALDEAIASFRLRGQELGNEGERLGKDLSAGLDRARPVVLTAAEMALADPLIVALLGGKEEAERIAGETPLAIAQALLDAQFNVEDAAAQLANVVEEALHPLIERAQIIAFLSSQELEDGLNSGIPAVRQAALELKEAAEARLAELSGNAWAYGNSVGTSFADGMNAAYGYVRDAAGNLARATRNQIGINSEPEDPSSPLHGITKWGGNIVKTIAEGIYGELGTGSAAAAALAGALVPSVGAPGGMVGGTAGGTTIQYILQVEGVPKEIGSRDDVIDAWLQMGSIGDRGVTR